MLFLYPFFLHSESNIYLNLEKYEEKEEKFIPLLRGSCYYLVFLFFCFSFWFSLYFFMG